MTATKKRHLKTEADLTPETLCITDIQREQKICNIILAKK
jgi:hypothetical protein